MRITIDQAGRVVLPKAVRDRFHLVAGTELELTSEPDGLRLAVLMSQPALVLRDGLLIHQGPAVTDVDVAAFINQSREGRNGEVVSG